MTEEEIDDSLYSWVSGLFLTEEVPAGFRNWPKDLQDGFLATNSIDTYESWDPNAISIKIDDTYDNLRGRLKTLGILPSEKGSAK